MPQLRRGGKHVFGWTVVRRDGTVRLPPDAVRESALPDRGHVVLLSGSRTSGGVRIANPRALEGTVFSDALGLLVAGSGPTASVNGALAGVGVVDSGILSTAPEVREALGFACGDRLLVIRGSGLGFVMAARGPLIVEALAHPELPVFE